MEVTNGEILGAVAPLRELIQVPLPVRASYRVACLARAVDGAAQDIEATRTRLVERFAERDAEGGFAPVVVDGEAQPGQVRIANPAAFQSELRELLGMTTELDVAPLRLSELGTACELAPATLLALGPLLADDAAHHSAGGEVGR